MSDRRRIKHQNSSLNRRLASFVELDIVGDTPFQISNTKSNTNGSDDVIFVGTVVPSERSRHSQRLRKRSSSESNSPFSVIDLTSQSSDHSSRLKKTHATEIPSVQLAPQPAPGASLAEAKCPVCLNCISDAASTFCGHLFCYECIHQSQRSMGKCPVCRRKLGLRQYHRLYI